MAPEDVILQAPWVYWLGIAAGAVRSKSPISILYPYYAFPRMPRSGQRWWVVVRETQKTRKKRAQYRNSRMHRVYRRFDFQGARGNGGGIPGRRLEWGM